MRFAPKNHPVLLVSQNYLQLPQRWAARTMLTCCPIQVWEHCRFSSCQNSAQLIPVTKSPAAEDHSTPVGLLMLEIKLSSCDRSPSLSPPQTRRDSSSLGACRATLDFHRGRYGRKPQASTCLPVEQTTKPPTSGLTCKHMVQIRSN